MILDALVQFVSLGAPLSLVAGGGIPIASPILDALGLGVGVAPTNIIGTRTLFGIDWGLGAKKPQLETVIGTGLVTGNAATLNIAFQGAVDTGAAGNYQPGTWITLVETGFIAVANLGANAIAARFDWPPAFPIATLPRFFRMLFSPSGVTNFTAGTVAYSIVTMGRDDQSNRYAAKNFAVV